MEVAKFTEAEKSASSSQQCQVHVQLFLGGGGGIQGFVQKEFVPAGQTVKGKFYWGFETAEEGHLAQTSRQVEEQQLVSPP
jgi:hypothetical protein